VTALDSCAGDVSNQVVTSGSVSSGVLGTYTITYDATDATGNPATPVVRTVHVVDTKAPALALVGSALITLTQGAPFTDPGATATDLCAGDLTQSIVVDSSVNTSIVGTYSITYDVTDPSGNPAVQAVRTVVVGIDLDAPVITLLGDDPLTVQCHQPYTDPGATAMDALAGDVSSRIVVTASGDNDSVGTFTLTYDATDWSGNAATPVVRTVVVVDTLPPTIQCPANVIASTDPGCVRRLGCPGRGRDGRGRVRCRGRHGGEGRRARARRPVPARVHADHLDGLRRLRLGELRPDGDRVRRRGAVDHLAFAARGSPCGRDSRVRRRARRAGPHGR
jgi:hypothetical protein